MNLMELLNVEKLNKENLIKYFIMFSVITIATLIIPTCGVLKQHAIFVGLIASTTYSILDMCYPNYIVKDTYSQPSMY